MSLTQTMFENLPEEVRQTLQLYVERMTDLYGPSLHAMLLYGSAVRGDYLPDGVFDIGKVALGLFDPGAGGGADVEANLSGIHLGEEILAEHGSEHQAGGADDEEPGGH